MRDIKIECLRGGQPFGYSLGNGDQFDSTMTLWTDGTKTTMAEYVNTDPSYRYKYFGILEEGDYKFICGRRADKASHPKVLYIYKADFIRDKNILHSSDLKPADRLLPSIVPNPNHGGKKFISAVLVHNRAITNDGSMGCITVDGFEAFISYFRIDDKGLFSLRRAPAWEPDVRYLTI